MLGSERRLRSLELNVLFKLQESKVQYHPQMQTTLKSFHEPVTSVKSYISTRVQSSMSADHLERARSFVVGRRSSSWQQANEDAAFPRRNIDERFRWTPLARWYVKTNQGRGCHYIVKSVSIYWLDICYFSDRRKKGARGVENLYKHLTLRRIHLTSRAGCYQSFRLITLSGTMFCL